MECFGNSVIGRRTLSPDFQCLTFHRALEHSLRRRRSVDGDQFAKSSKIIMRMMVGLWIFIFMVTVTTGSLTPYSSSFVLRHREAIL